MIYPIYVHKDENSSYGGSFPDLPGCFTAADDLADLPRMAQEAVEVHFEGEDLDIPPPGDIANWKDHPDYQGGFWLLVDIDLTRVNARRQRVDVSLPAHLLRQIDRYAAAHHLTRSGFLARAAREAMER